MPEIELTATFLDAYQKLPASIQKKVKKALRLLAENPRHPSLQAKPIHSAPGIFEARIDRSYRMSFERLAGDVLRLRVIGNHDEVLNKP
jgi:mRNA interferase RelE/StbE